MSTRLTFKRGDTFRLAGVVKVGGVVQDMTGWTIKAQVRGLRPSGPDALISELTGTWLDAAGGALQLLDASTADWPLGDATIDVRLTSPSGDKTTTSSARFIIAEAVTQDA